jgi:hypothetical protein
MVDKLNFQHNPSKSFCHEKEKKSVVLKIASLCNILDGILNVFSCWLNGFQDFHIFLLKIKKKFGEILNSISFFCEDDNVITVCCRVQCVGPAVA